MAIRPLPTTWANWIDDVRAGSQRIDAHDKDDLLAAVSFAVETGQRIRAVGSGHSMSTCALPRELHVDLAGHSGIFPKVEWLKAQPPGLGTGQRLVRVKAGTRLKTLNRILLPELPRAAAMINLGAFDGQTLAGAISTATHGTGITLGSLADLVVSMDMVTVTKSSDGTPHVQMRRIEPTDGVTDRNAFNQDRARHGMVLEQDDDTFHAAVVSYGCMGIAHSYILRVRDAYWLREDTTLMDWPALRAALKDPIVTEPGLGKRVPKFVAEDRHFWALINVAEAQGKKAKEDLACNVVRRNIAPADDKPAVWLHDGWPPERRNPFFRNLFKELLGGIAAPRAHQDNDRFGDTLRKRYFEKEAKDAPFASNRTASASYICLRRERDTSAPDKAPDPPDKALSLELAVPAEHAALAVDTVIDAIRDQPWFFAIPIGLRFAAPSSHHLAPNFGRCTAYVEVAFLQTGARDESGQLSPEETIDRIAKPALRRIERLVEQHPELQGRPHLGKFHAVDHEALLQQYPQAEQWEAVYRRFNAFGTFDNAFTDQLGLSGGR